MQRRDFLATGSSFIAAGILSAALSGCAMDPTASLIDAIRRLLTLSSQRALARLMAPGGFYDDQVARISLPSELSSSGSLVTRVLLSSLVRDRLVVAVNRAAEQGANRAAPIIADSIRSLNPADAAAILRAGGPSATNLLRQSMGDALIGNIMPGVDESLRLFDNEAVSQALKLVTGINFAGLRDDVTHKASDAIYNAIGREEEAIRADPKGKGDPVIATALSLVGVL